MMTMITVQQLVTIFTGHAVTDNINTLRFAIGHSRRTVCNACNKLSHST